MATSNAILGTVNEVCIVTPNIRSTIAGWQALGVTPFTLFTFDATSVSNRHLHGGPADFELLVAFAKQKDLVIEIMQPLNGTSSLMAEYLEANGGREGVQHVAFDMGEIPMDKRIEVMKGRGFEVAMEGVWKGKKGECRFVFFDTVGKGVGTCIESIEFSDDWEEPDGEVIGW